MLITAALGAMVLAHREPHEPKRGQREQMRDRFKVGTHPTPLPGPGVYARHNAVDTPALLPDGSPSELSVPAAVEELRLERGRNPQPAAAARPAVRDEAVMSPTYYLYLSAILFTIGSLGVLLRRNAIVVFMCVELMLNAGNLALVTFSRINGDLNGQIMAFFVMVVAAAEVVVGLAIIVSVFRTRRSASVDDASLLKY